MFNLFEDEDDIFMGSPKSKLMDVIFNANNDRVRVELQKFIDRTAALELMVADKLGDEIDERELHRFTLSHQDVVESHAKSLYIELMGAILSQSE